MKLKKYNQISQCRDASAAAQVQCAALSIQSVSKSVTQNEFRVVILA